MADKTLHFQGDLHLQERNGEWYIENRETGDVSGPVNIGELKSDVVDAQELSTKDANRRLCVTQFDGADLGEQINSAVATIPDREDAYLYAEAGEHTLSTPADLTDFHGLTVDLSGTFINIATDGQPGFDLTDSWDWHFNFERMNGDTSTPPSSGILIGATSDFERTGTGDAKGGGHERKWLSGGVMWGNYQYAPVWKAGRERCRIEGDYANDASQGYSLVLTGNNRAEVNGSVVGESTPHKTEAIGAISNNKTWISNASFLSILNDGDGIVYLEGHMNESAFRDVEVFGRNEPGLFRVDCSQNDVKNLRFDNLRLRVDHLDDLGAHSRSFYVDDDGGGYRFGDVHINDFKTSNSENDADLPAIETFGTAQLTNITISGNSDLRARSTGIKSDQQIKDVETTYTDYDNPEFSISALLDNSVVTNGTVANGTTVVNTGKRRDVVFESSGDHALKGDGGGVILKNVTAKSTESSSHAVHLADQTSGPNSWIHGVLVAESGDDGIWMDRMRQSIISNCRTNGYGDSIAGNDLFLRNGQRVVITSNYFNGDVEIGSGSTDTIMSGNFVRGTFTDNGTRTLVNGWGTNNGDPNSTGEWNGNGREGVSVVDTANSAKYTYRGGSWV